MKNIKEFLIIVILIAAILTGFFGSLVGADWLETYCLTTFLLITLYGLFVRKVV